jgi:signal transduction histidine kinase
MFRRPEFLATTAFRWTLTAAAVFICAFGASFGLIYAQTIYFLTRQVDSALIGTADAITAPPSRALAARLQAYLEADPRHVHAAALFDRDGRVLAGNVVAPPPSLAVGPIPGSYTITRVDPQGFAQVEPVRAVARRLADGRVLFLARDVAELDALTDQFSRTLLLGLVPAVIMAIAAGAVVSRRNVRRIENMVAASRRIMSGRLDQRLPVRDTGDDVDRLAGIVNVMLNEIERLMSEVSGAGDAMAHDLRTPLTRMRSRLERVRADPEATRQDLRAAMDRAIGDLDSVGATIEALLRISEIEHGRRRAGFATVALGGLARDVAELYGPVAEEKGVRLVLALRPTEAVWGDRDMLFEAIANLVDNAVKFTPAGGTVTLSALTGEHGPEVIVDDDGPGIPLAERQAVLRRFYRSDRCRRAAGTGLGLSLVAAVARLHDITLTIGERARGTRVILACRRLPSQEPSQARGRDLAPIPAEPS